MLSDIPRQQLTAIYTLNSKIAEDDKLCEAYLRDYCGECRREIAALSAAVRWGVPKSLRETSSMPVATLRANLARRLEENQGLDSENALWAVDVWAAVIRPSNVGWPAGASAAPIPPAGPRPAPPNAQNPVMDWSHPQAPAPPPYSPPAVQSHYVPPAVAAGVLSPPASVHGTPTSQPAYPQYPAQPAYPQFPPPAPQPAVAIPFAAAAAAFLAGQDSPELKAVQSYLKLQLKIRKPNSLMEEIQAASVAPGIAKNMVNRVRRSKAIVGLFIAVAILIAGFVMLGNGTDAQGEVTALGTIGFFVFAGGCLYSLWSVIRIVRFS